jgi:hypothetical protein
MKKSMLLLASSLAIFLCSCKKDETTTEPPTEKTIEFLVNGSASRGNYNLFSFETGKEVASADSNSNKWDFGLRFETFIINNEASGPGDAFVKIADKPFAEVTDGALSGWKYDTTSSQKAIKGSEWYDYNDLTRQFSPKAGKTFVFVTAKGKYAKMEMIKADPADDNGNPVTPPTRPTKIKYTLRYFFQKNGTSSLQ